MEVSVNAELKCPALPSQRSCNVKIEGITHILVAVSPENT